MEISEVVYVQCMNKQIKKCDRNCNDNFLYINVFLLMLLLIYNVVREAMRFILDDNKQIGDMILNQMLEY